MERGEIAVRITKSLTKNLGNYNSARIEYSMEKVAAIVTDKYINSELHKENVRSVMEAKKNKIINFPQFDDDGK